MFFFLCVFVQVTILYSQDNDKYFKRLNTLVTGSEATDRIA